MPENARRPERRDVSPRALLAFAAGLILFLTSALAILALLFDTTARWPGYEATRERDLASPTFQRSPATDLATFRRREREALIEFEWVDRKAGIARIPVSDAMRIVTEKGLPDWSRGAAPEDAECRRLTNAVPRAPHAARCRAGESPEPAGDGE